MSKGFSVCHLTSVHSAGDIRIFQKECRSLAQAGFKVSLVAPHERDATIDGVEICAVPRLKGRLARMTLTIARVFSRALRVDADLYHFHDPDLIPVGLLLKLCKKRVIYDAHENLPEDIRVKHYLHPWVRSVLAAFASVVEAAAGTVLDGIVTVVPKIAARFPAPKTIVLANFPLLQQAPAKTSAWAEAATPVTLAYIGGLSEFRGILEMVRTVAIVNERHPARLLMAGAFTRPEFEQAVRAEPGWKYVDYLGMLSSREALALLQRSHIGLLLFKPSPHNIESSPNKLFEYLMYDLPIVISDFPYWRASLESFHCSMFVDPTSPAAAAAAVCWLIEHPLEAAAMGVQGGRAVDEEFNWQSEAKKLVGFYDQILGVRHA